MKNEIKVYMQYPWGLKDSPYYKSLLENPPEKVKYLGSEKKNVITNKRFFFLFGLLKKIIKFGLKIVNLERPNSHLTKTNEQFDLIHCAHCLSENEDKPWVADIEMYGSLFIASKRSNKLDKKIKDIILRDNCKKILPWSNGIKKSILRYIPEIEKKIEVVYPAIPERNQKTIKKNDIPTVLFISRYFYTKGGLMALEVLERLRRKYGCKVVVISSVPMYLKKKYSSLEFYELLPQTELFRLMNNSDILLYPTTSDTFGFSLLESMSFGIPIVALKTPWTQSIGEIVENNKNGFLIETNEIPSQRKIGILENQLINKLTEKCSILIEDKKLKEKMSRYCLNEIKNGKFSTKERNKKLRKIYEEALK